MAAHAACHANHATATNAPKVDKPSASVQILVEVFLTAHKSSKVANISRHHLPVAAHAACYANHATATNAPKVDKPSASVQILVEVFPTAHKSSEVANISRHHLPVAAHAACYANHATATNAPKVDKPSASVQILVEVFLTAHKSSKVANISRHHLPVADHAACHANHATATNAPKVDKPSASVQILVEVFLTAHKSSKVANISHHHLPVADHAACYANHATATNAPKVDKPSASVQILVEVFLTAHKSSKVANISRHHLPVADHAACHANHATATNAPKVDKPSASVQILVEVFLTAHKSSKVANISRHHLPMAARQLMLHAIPSMQGCGVCSLIFSAFNGLSLCKVLRLTPDNHEQ